MKIFYFILSFIFFILCTILPIGIDYWIYISPIWLTTQTIRFSGSVMFLGLAFFGVCSFFAGLNDK